MKNRIIAKTIKSSSRLAVLFAFGLILLAPLSAYAAVAQPGGNSSSSGATPGQLDPELDQHLDRSTILYSGKIYFDSKIDDNYTYNDKAGGKCPDRIKGLSDKNTKATFEKRSENVADGSCKVESSKKISLADSNRSYMPLVYINDTTVMTSDRKVTFTYDSKEKNFYQEGADKHGGEKCKDWVKVSNKDSYQASSEFYVNVDTGKSLRGNWDNYSLYSDWSDQMDIEDKIEKGTNALNTTQHLANNCEAHGPAKFKVSMVYYQNPKIANKATITSADVGLKNADGTTAKPGVVAGTETLEIDNCNATGNPLTWIICPIIDGLGSLADSLHESLTKQLVLGSSDPGSSNDPNKIFCNGSTNETCSSYHDAWKIVRNIALGLMVLAGLAILLAQIFGAEILDAYTIRKVLPRILTAAIGITLSWELLRFLIIFINDVGVGIYSIMVGPFQGISGEGFGGAGFVTQLIVGGVLFAAVGGILGALTLLVTAALAFFVAFIVIVLRNLLITVFLILAPVAIVMYIMPNTQKYYKIWWENLIKALLMFPIIEAMIAAGYIFSRIAYSSGDDMGKVVGLVAYFAPFLMIPMTFRLAGGLMNAAGNFVNGRAQPAFNAVNGFRANRRKQNFAKAGHRALSGNALGKAPALRRANDAIQAAALMSQGKVGIPTKSNIRTAMNDFTGGAALGEFMEKSESFKSWSADDAKLRAALSGSTTRAGLAQALAAADSGRFGFDNAANAQAREDAVSQILRSQKEVGTKTFQKASFLAQTKTGTGYQDADGEFRADWVMNDINKIWGDDRNGAAKAIAMARGNLQQSGQMAGAASFGGWMGAAETMWNARGQDTETQKQVATQAHNAVIDDAIDGARGAEAVHGKPSSARAYANGYKRRIQKFERILNNPDVSEADKAAAHQNLVQTMASAAGVYDAMGSTSANNASAFAEELFKYKLKLPTQGSSPVYGPNGNVLSYPKEEKEYSVQQLVSDQMFGDESFIQRRKEYGSYLERQAANSRAQYNNPEDPGSIPPSFPK